MRQLNYQVRLMCWTKIFKSFKFSIDKLMEKLDNTKPVEKTPEEEKERIDKIFEKNR